MQLYKKLGEIETIPHPKTGTWRQREAIVKVNGKARTIKIIDRYERRLEEYFVANSIAIS